MVVEFLQIEFLGAACAQVLQLDEVAQGAANLDLLLLPSNFSSVIRGRDSGSPCERAKGV